MKQEPDHSRCRRGRLRCTPTGSAGLLAHLLGNAFGTTPVEDDPAFTNALSRVHHPYGSKHFIPKLRRSIQAGAKDRVGLSLGVTNPVSDYLSVLNWVTLYLMILSALSWTHIPPRAFLRWFLNQLSPVAPLAAVAFKSDLTTAFSTLSRALWLAQ